MNELSHIDPSTVCTVTVTFNPDTSLLQAQLLALPTACEKFIVDNASSAILFEKIWFLAKSIPNVHVLRNDSNMGLAAAANHGVQSTSVLRVEPEFVLLLDQDSVPQAGSVETLIGAFRALERNGQKVGCVGPLLLDPQTGLSHGFHQLTRWRWRRVYPPPSSATPVRCANLNGSGTLVRIELFRRLRGLDEPLFIDHVDTEWAFRVQAHGYSLWGVPNSMFSHKMGMTSRRIWCMGWRLWPDRSPQRHYYLFRNAIILTRRAYVPLVWKVWAIVKLAVTALVTLILGPKQCEQGTNMVRGLRDGYLHAYSCSGFDQKRS